MPFGNTRAGGSYAEALVRPSRITAFRTLAAATGCAPCATRINPCTTGINPCTTGINPCATRINHCAAEYSR
jgi:hypothetical protein